MRTAHRRDFWSCPRRGSGLMDVLCSDCGGSAVTIYRGADGVTVLDATCVGCGEARATKVAAARWTDGGTVELVSGRVRFIKGLYNDRKER
jgi:hypothetical protein